MKELKFPNYSINQFGNSCEGILVVLFEIITNYHGISRISWIKLGFIVITPNPKLIGEIKLGHISSVSSLTEISMDSDWSKDNDNKEDSDAEMSSVEFL